MLSKKKEELLNKIKDIKDKKSSGGGGIHG